MRSPRAPAWVFREPGSSGFHPLGLLPRPLPAGNDPGRGGETGKSSRDLRGPPPSTPRPSFLPGPKAKTPALGLCLLRSPRRGGGWAASGGPRCAQMLTALKSTKGFSRARPSGFSRAPALPLRAPGSTGRGRSEGPQHELGQRAACRPESRQWRHRELESETPRRPRSRVYTRPLGPAPRFLELRGRPSCNV